MTHLNRFELVLPQVQYTAREKQAIVNCLMGMMQIDNNVANKEVDAMQEIFNFIHVTEDDFNAATDFKSREQVISTLKGMDDVKLYSFGRFLASILCADGVVDPCEHRMWQMIYSELNLKNVEEKYERQFSKWR